MVAAEPPRTLFEDPAFLAVDKPAGRLVIPGRGDDPASCLRLELEGVRNERLWVVHRLDRDTSGVLLLARTAEAHRALSLAFEHRVVRKTYQAFTRGVPAADRGTLDVPLHPARRNKTRPALPGEPGALEARTDYGVLRRWLSPLGPLGLLEARPHTGRHHQVRVHLRYAGAPLLVDPLYGGTAALRAADLGLPGDEPLCTRLTLHAASVEFPHPSTGETMRLEAPLPADLARLAETLDGLGPPVP